MRKIIVLFLLSCVVLLWGCIRFPLSDEQKKQVDELEKKGSAWAELGKYDKALKEYDAALNINPDSAKIHRLKGIVYYYQDLMDLALDELDKSIQLDESNPQAYAWRGFVYYNLRDYNNAILNYDKALKLNPTRDEKIDINFNLGRAYFAQNDYISSVYYWEEALRLDPQNKEIPKFIDRAKQLME